MTAQLMPKYFAACDQAVRTFSLFHIWRTAEEQSDLSIHALLKTFFWSRLIITATRSPGRYWLTEFTVAISSSNWRAWDLKFAICGLNRVRRGFSAETASSRLNQCRYLAHSPENTYRTWENRKRFTIDPQSSAASITYHSLSGRHNT